MNTTPTTGEAPPRRAGFAAALRAGAAALAAAVILPLLPMAAAPAAQAAENPGITFSNVTITEGSRPLTADGFLPASNSIGIQTWNPGAVAGSAGQYVMFGFDVAIPDDAQPGESFSLILPEFWQARGGSSLAPLTDDDGNVIATPKISVVNGQVKVTFTLTNFVTSRVGIQGQYSFMAQEVASPARQEGDLVGDVLTGTGAVLGTLKTRIPSAAWSASALSMSWTGNATTPTGGVEFRSLPSFDGTSDVDVTVYAGAGYIFDCDALTNQDPTVATGIGLVDIGSVRNSLPTEEWLLDPSKYTLACDGGSFTLHMPASSWTSADASTGQVLRILTTRIPTDDSWLTDGAVFAYADLTQNGAVSELNGRVTPPGSSGSGTSSQLPPGAFETLMFQDLDGNNVYDAGTDVLLPGITVRITGTTKAGVAVDTTVTSDDQGRVRVTLREGDYTATIENPPAGLAQVTPNIGDDEFDSDFDNGQATFTITSRTTTARDGGFATPVIALDTFTVEKVLAGDASDWIDPATEFTIDYSYPAGVDYPAGTGSIVIAADGKPVESKQIPVGAIVTLTEQTPAAVSGAVWGTPLFSTAQVTVGVDTKVTVTNQIDQAFGQISVQKIVSGNAADLVPGSTAFTVKYSYPATAHYPSGGGDLTILADGSLATSELLPADAVVSIIEETPVEIDGLEWTGVSYSSATTTVAANGVLALTVTNEATLEDVVKPHDPSTEIPAPSAPTTPPAQTPAEGTVTPAPSAANTATAAPATALALTGTSNAWGIGLLVATLLLGGALRVAARRRALRN
ncbi:DUF5979 domain-containing protein [Lysinibacter cavernae]|uniref:SD-repeat containing protein B domain-containing protein n=1 Tax=Lysinibacter cavernae TaxID=1640652 RepID=A0A7X5TSY6_9MICO|nr:DUF5979 domain-containing protein [Lysinibacter cavernae]NIH52959.1 hypothetical protein [Lysinibacter cavernae]